LYTETGAELFAVAPEELTDIVELEPWLGAIVRAGQRVLREDPKWPWLGVLGTDSDHGGPVRLIKQIALGDTLVSAATNPYSEHRENWRAPSLRGGSGNTSFPVVIRGNARGYSWDVASSSATEEATTTCALLSLASGTFWRIREQPCPDQGQAVVIPEWRWDSQGTAPDVHLLGAAETFDPPEWISAARTLVDSDDVFARSLLAYHQGLLLEQVSPSFALVCFTGSIEGIGVRETAESRNREQFRAGLRTALDETDVNELVKLWKPRSSTAHSGKLHAGEGSGSEIVSFLPHYFSNEPNSINFRWQSLRRLQEASRSVLIASIERRLRDASQ
jgi:hypothetical protein